jgi:Tfp pilus assembly protein PilZ
MSIEHRQAERFDAEYIVTVRPEGAMHWGGPASMVNLSKGGLCFVVDVELKQGQKVAIDIPTDNPVITLKAKVVWCRPQRDKFSVGAEFIEMSDARRARIVEMNTAIRAYHKMHNASGASAMSAQQAAVEWFSRHADTFLAGV